MPAPGETYRRADPSQPKPCISYGLPFHEAAAWHAENTFHASRIYVIVSGTISKTQDWSNLQDALGKDKIVGVRYGIKPHTPLAEVFELTADLKKTRPDLVITLGGGSIIDGVKLARVFAANDILTTEARKAFLDKTKAFLGRKDDPEDVAPADIPCIFIPTSLSGGEWTQASGATDTEGHKAAYKHASMFADLVICDPALTLPLPDRFWFSTGVRTIDHCVEGLSGTSEFEGADAIRDAVAETLRTILSNLLATKTGDHDDLHARLQCQLSTAIISRTPAIGVGPSHGIGHQLGPLGVGHGETSCILLPNVLKFNCKYGDELTRTRQERIRGIFWSEPALRRLFRERGLEEGSADAGDLFDAYLRVLGMPRTLKGMGIRRDQFEALVETSLRDPCTLMGPVKIGREGVLEILDMAWDD